MFEDLPLKGTMVEGAKDPVPTCTTQSEELVRIPSLMNWMAAPLLKSTTATVLKESRSLTVSAASQKKIPWTAGPTSPYEDGNTCSQSFYCPQQLEKAVHVPYFESIASLILPFEAPRHLRNSARSELVQYIR